MKSDCLLTTLLYGIDFILNPSPLKILMSGEKWPLHHRKYASQLSKLQSKGLVEKKKDPETNKWAIQLTQEGRLRALGGRDATTHWNQDWDSNWHLLMFDISIENNALRRRLARWRNANCIGFLQKSIWISHTPMAEVTAILDQHKTKVDSVFALKGIPDTTGISTNEEIVAASWNFYEINEAWRTYMDHATQSPPNTEAPDIIRNWISKESTLWAQALRKDPLLPKSLHPENYVGTKAWKLRTQFLLQAEPLLKALGDL